MELPYIEPLLIYSEVGEWTHPEIEEISKELEKMKDCNNLIGNLMKINVEMASNTFYLVAVTDDKGYKEIMTDKINQYMDFLFLVLSEDVWLPGGEQFVFSEYGTKFNQTYHLNTEKWSCTVSPDVSINHDKNDWWFDT